MSEINVGPTAEAIELMAEQFREVAMKLEAIAAGIRKDNNFHRVGEAAGCVANVYGNLRLDLLVVRPLREFGAN